MKNQRTLAELRHIGDEVFAEAQEAIETARQIIHTCRELNMELKRPMAEFRERQKHSLEVSPLARMEKAYRGGGIFRE